MLDKLGEEIALENKAGIILIYLFYFLSYCYNSFTIE